MTDLIIDPSDPAHLYILDGAIEESTDDGHTWADLAGVFFNGYPPQFLAMDPFGPNNLYATASSGMVHSTDGGHTWAASDSQDPTITKLIFDPYHRGLVYILDAAGVERSVDGGLVWTRIDAGLNGDTVMTLSFDPLGTRILAGTASHGVMEFQFPVPTTCVADSHTFCLNNGRFQVSVQWTDFNGNTGLGSVVPGASSNDSGVMRFFGPDNWELLIKVLNGCGVNGHYWVFGAAATDVAYTIQVTDTQTGEIRTYTNPLGTTSPAITDTAAFGSCP